MKVAAREDRKPRSEHLVEQVGARCRLPRVEVVPELLATVPEMIGLLLDLAGRDRMRRDRQAAIRVNPPAQLERVRLGADELADSESQDMGRSLVRQRVLRELEARDDDHSILAPGALGFGKDDLAIEREVGRCERAPEIARRAPDQPGVLAQVIGDRDRAEAPRAVEIDELGNGHPPVAEGRVHVKVGEELPAHGMIIGGRPRQGGQVPVRVWLCQGSVRGSGRDDGRSRSRRLEPEPEGQRTSLHHRIRRPLRLRG